MFLLHIGGLTGRRLPIFCFTASLLWFGDGAPAWLTAAVEKGGKGAIFSYQTPRKHLCTCVCACVCVCLTLSLCIFPNKLPYSHLSVCRQRGWRKFMLPMPVLSVKLIRLRAPDNSIVSDSFNNRNTPRPPQDARTTVKTSSLTKLPDITVLLNSALWQDWAESTGTVPRG